MLPFRPEEGWKQVGKGFSDSCAGFGDKGFSYLKRLPNTQCERLLFGAFFPAGQPAGQGAFFGEDLLDLGFE
jgi:hypothetical protein